MIAELWEMICCEKCGNNFSYMGPREFRSRFTPFIECPCCGYRNDITMDFEDLEVYK